MRSWRPLALLLALTASLPAQPASGWLGGGGEAPAAPRSPLLEAVEAFWVHMEAAGLAGSPVVLPPHQLEELVLEDPELRPGKPVPEELAELAAARPQLAASLRAIRSPGLAALARAEPALATDLPGPALMRRVGDARFLVLEAWVGGREAAARELLESLLVVGELVARGAPGEELVGRHASLRLGLEIHGQVLRDLWWAAGRGFVSERAALAQVLSGFAALRVPWQRFPEPAKVAPAGWLGVASQAAPIPMRPRPVHLAGLFREVLLQGLRAWTGSDVVDPLGTPSGPLRRSVRDPTRPPRVYSVGLDGRDEGGRAPGDFPLFPLPEGRLPRALPRP